MSVHLPLILSQTGLTCFRRCPREYFYVYVKLRKRRSRIEALRFGSFFHVGLNAWWACAVESKSGWEESTQRLAAATSALHRRAALHREDADPFDFVKATALLAGYTARWGGEGYRTIAVEKNFRLDYGEFVQVGSIDAIAERQWISNVEHKTTAADISPTSDYWRGRDVLDPQVSTYMEASKAMGYDVRDTLYDVIRKPALIPYKATPEESRKYTKPTKAEPVPRLYAGQREKDETPEEYGMRLTEDIAADPGKYFQRRTIVRLEHDDAAHEVDVADTALMIAHCVEHAAWPRSPNACERFGRLCDFHDVCSGTASIDDEVRFMSKTKQHEELE
jgi:hypothetical protein